MTMHIETMAPNSKRGRPKWKGVVIASQLASSMPSKRSGRAPCASRDAGHDARAAPRCWPPVRGRSATATITTASTTAGDRQVGRIAVGRVGHRMADAVDHRRLGRLAAGGPVDRHAHQRDADQRDHGAGHQRREDAEQPAHQRRQRDAEDAGRDGRAVDRRQAERGVERCSRWRASQRSFRILRGGQLLRSRLWHDVLRPVPGSPVRASARVIPGDAMKVRLSFLHCQVAAVLARIQARSRRISTDSRRA